jgi:hypothetical protein
MMAIWSKHGWYIISYLKIEEQDMPFGENKNRRNTR